MKASYIHTWVGDFIVVTDENYVTTIPVDPANTDYSNIMALAAAGELVIAPAGSQE